MESTLALPRRTRIQAKQAMRPKLAQRVGSAAFKTTDLIPHVVEWSANGHRESPV